VLLHAAWKPADGQVRVEAETEEEVGLRMAWSSDAPFFTSRK